MSKFTIIHPYSRRGRLNIQRELAKAGLLGVKGLNPVLSRGSFGSHAGGGGGGTPITVIGFSSTLFNNQATWTFSEALTSDGTRPLELEVSTFNSGGFVAPNGLVTTVVSGDGTAAWVIQYGCNFGGSGDLWRVQSTPSHVASPSDFATRFTVPQSGTNF